MSARALSRLAPSAVLAMLSLACAKAPPSGGAGTYRGVATGAKEIGILEVTVEDADKGALPATGTLKFPSKSISLTGTLNKSKTELSLTSSDGFKVVGTSRPGYAYGSYTDAAGEATGSFGVLLQSSDWSVNLFCGGMQNTSSTDPDAQGAGLPLAITGVPGGGAFCVGSGFVWMGDLDKNHKVDCSPSAGASIAGDVTATSGNQWTSNGYSGPWTVTPCPDNGANGSVPDAGSSD